MADTAAVPAPTAADASSGGRLKLVLALVAVLALAAVGAKMFLFAPADAPEATPAAAPEEGPVVAIGQMTTSLAGTGAHYVRVDLAAVTAADADSSTLEDRFPLMRDEALDVLMGFTPEQLRTVAGADELRAALTERAQSVWADGEVLRVVLTDLLVQ